MHIHDIYLINHTTWHSSADAIHSWSTRIKRFLALCFFWFYVFISNAALTSATFSLNILNLLRSPTAFELTDKKYFFALLT